MLLIKDILDSKTFDTVSVSSQTTATEAAKVMVQNKVGAVMVIDDETVKGIFTERDLMNKVVAQGLAPDSVTMAAVMTSQIACGTPQMELREAGEIMTQNRIRHLPIMENGVVLGVVSSGDVLAWKLKDQEFSCKQLEDYFYNS